MLRRFGIFIFLAAISGVALPAVAQPAPDRNCTDDRGSDRCAEAPQARTRQLFGVRSIEEHRDAGDQVRRIFYVDGYGRDMVAIAFVRAPGRDPTAFVHFPRREGEPAIEPLQAPIPQPVWLDMLGRSANFDRTFVAPPESPGVASICLHSWVYTVEANDPARANAAPASLRRKTEDACENGPAQSFAADLQRAALALFPHCSQLDPEQHRNPASRLAACRLLGGDRMAAAQVLNRAEAFRRARDPDARNALAGIFAMRARIDWNGVRNPADQADAAAFWMARLGEAEGANFYYERAEGLAADRVRLTGSLQRSVEGAQGSRTTHYRARVTMVWVLTTVQEFQVESATIGPWEIYRPR